MTTLKKINSSILIFLFWLDKCRYIATDIVTMIFNNTSVAYFPKIDKVFKEILLDWNCFFFCFFFKGLCPIQYVVKLRFCSIKPRVCIICWLKTCHIISWTHLYIKRCMSIAFVLQKTACWRMLSLSGQACNLTLVQSDSSSNVT